jgi:hypothetical protein
MVVTRKRSSPSLTGTAGAMRGRGRDARATVDGATKLADPGPIARRQAGYPVACTLCTTRLETVARTARSFVPSSGPACPSLGAWSGTSCAARVTHNRPGLSIASSARARAVSFSERGRRYPGRPFGLRQRASGCRRSAGSFSFQRDASPRDIASASPGQASRTNLQRRRASTGSPRSSARTARLRRVRWP